MNEAKPRKPEQGQAMAADGRLRRSERTKHKIMSAYLTLVRLYLREPSMREVAEVAGCALRSVYERMSDTHTLRLAALDHAINGTLRKFDVQLSDLGRQLRLQAIVKFQVEEYEQWGPLWHFLMQYGHLPDVKDRLDQIRHRVLRDRMIDLYRNELAGSSEADRANWLQLLNATTSLESWQYLRYFENLPIEKVCEQWIWYVDRILTAALSDTEKAGATMAVQ
jgi:AcrR family transcriptional regulator